MTEREFVNGKGQPVVIPWPYLTTNDAGHLLGVSGSYLNKLANRPIPAIRVRGRRNTLVWLWQRDAVEQLAAKLLRKVE